MKVLAIVPARGGSKSVPKKNIRLLGGKPLLAHSIGHGLQAKRIDRVVISTDSEEIAKVAREFGGDVPFLRPANFADDYSLDIDFYLHALEWLRENENYVPDAVINLRPTTPVRDPEVLDQAISLFERRPEIDSMRAVRAADKTPFKMWVKGERGMMRPLFSSFGEFEEPYNMPRQLLPEALVQDGYFDITWTKVVLEKKSVTGDTVLPFVVPGHPIDIDHESDLVKAELLF